MNKKDFKCYMHQRLGRCVLALQSSNDIEKYKETVLWGCLHNLSYDTQCEGTRAAYIYELTTYFKDEDYFLIPTIEAFEKIPRRSDWLFSHFTELLRSFAENGNETAKKALKPIKAPSVEDLKTEVEKYDRLSPALRVRFSRRAGKDEKQRLAEEVLQEPDLTRKAELLSVFAFRDENFPLSHETIIEYSKSSQERLREVSLDVLTNCHSHTVRQFAHELLKRGEHRSYALCILLRNYTPKDKPLLLTELYNIKVDYKNEGEWHSIDSKILNVCNQDVKLPKEFFFYVYETTLCSCCREYAIRALAKHRWLTRDIIEECRYDSNHEISDYVNRYDPPISDGPLPRQKG